MKIYQCHKRVIAGKIASIERSTVTRLLMDDGDYADVSIEWMERCRPSVGGYFIRYPDGYESFSPADAFESGYQVLHTPTTLETKFRTSVDDVYALRVDKGQHGVEVALFGDRYSIRGDLFVRKT